MKPIDWTKFSYKHNKEVFKFCCRVDDRVEIRSNDENQPIKITYRINGGCFTYLPKEYVPVGEALVKFIKDSQKERWEDQPAPEGFRWEVGEYDIYLVDEFYRGRVSMGKTPEHYERYLLYCKAYEKVVLGK